MYRPDLLAAKSTIVRASFSAGDRLAPKVAGKACLHAHGALHARAGRIIQLAKLSDFHWLSRVRSTQIGITDNIHVPSAFQAGKPCALNRSCGFDALANASEGSPSRVSVSFW